MAHSTSRRQLIAQFGIGIAAGLVTPYVASSRPIQPADKSLGESELGKKHGNYVAASRLSGQLGKYRVQNRIVNMSSAMVKFDYRAALLIDWVPKQEAVDDEGNSLLVRPVSSALVLHS